MIDPVLIESYNKTRPFAADKFCYAPFLSLYFGHEGKVTACCENREHLLGTYPQQTISEIWNGEATRQLRQYISEQNLWHGCKGCDFDLRSGNLEGVKAKIFDHPRMQQKNPEYPAMFEFELENTCNLECVMCTGIFSSSIRKNREHLPPILSPYDEAFVRQLEPYIPYLSGANFFGGEPFLVETYYSIWERMADLNPGMNIWVTTNSTILNNRVKNLLNRLKFNLTLSIDSIEKETYEKIRVNASFERVMENVEYFLQYRKSAQTGCTINTCPMVPNWKELPRIVQWGSDKGVAVNIIAVRFPESHSLRSLTSGELANIAAYYKTFTISGEDGIHRRNRKQFEDYILQVEQWRRLREDEDLTASLANAEDLFPAVKNRIINGLNFSSGSLESREARIGPSLEKICSIQKKLDSIAPELGHAVWTVALQTDIDGMLHSLYTFGEDELLAQTRGGIWQVINTIHEDTEEATHLRRLKVYIDYLKLIGISQDRCDAAVVKWRTALSSLKERGNGKAESIFQTINKNSISVFGDALLEGNEEKTLKEWGSSFG